MTFEIVDKGSKIRSKIYQHRLEIGLLVKNLSISIRSGVVARLIRLTWVTGTITPIWMEDGWRENCQTSPVLISAELVNHNDKCKRC